MNRGQESEEGRGKRPKSGACGGGPCTSPCKSTWQVGQATQGLKEERRTGRGGRQRPRDASMGRE